MKKEFLLDNDGNIADCESNIANMNIFEFINIFYGWQGFLPFMINKVQLQILYNAILDVLCGIVVIIFFIPAQIVMPIVSIFKAHNKIKNAKKFVKRQNDLRKNKNEI